MDMQKHEDTEVVEQKVCLWLEKKGLPYERYLNLPTHNKIVLRNLVGTPTRPTTHRERQNLYKELCLPDMAGRESINPVDFIPGEEIEKFFTPLTPSETLSEWQKY